MILVAAGWYTLQYGPCPACRLCDVPAPSAEVVPAKPEEAADTALSHPATEALEPQPDQAEPAVPTFAEAAEAFTLAVLAAAPEGLARGQLIGEPGQPLEFAARWRNHDLLSYTGLTFDPQTGSFLQTPDDVAAWFARQVAALIRAESLQGFRLKLDDRYDQALVPASIQEAHIAGVEDGRPVVSLVIRLRLRDDPDPEGGFLCHGHLTEDVFVPDAAARPAFEQYLRALQRP